MENRPHHHDRPGTLGDIRLWLKRNGQTVPSRDADAVAKYLRLAIDANNRWGGVLIPLTIDRPRSVGLPWQNDFEGKRLPYARHPIQPHSIGKQLAIGSFGLLVMLALIWTFAR
jgi:hypothetical protein